MHQRIHLLLKQRLAAGDFDQRAAVSIDLADDIVQRTLAGPRRRRTAYRTRYSGDRTR